MGFFTPCAASAAGTWHETEAKFTSGAVRHLVSAADAAYSPEGFILP